MPLIFWCSVRYPLASSSVSVIYSLGILVINPLSLVNWLTLLGIVGLFWTLLQSTLSAVPPPLAERTPSFILKPVPILTPPSWVALAVGNVYSDGIVGLLVKSL